MQCEVSSKGSFSSQGISRFTFSLAASYKAALKSNNQSNTKGTYRDADIYCHPHAPPRSRGTLPATGVALRRWLRPELPREPVQPEQRRRRWWRRLLCSKLSRIPMQPKQHCWWCWSFWWIPIPTHQLQQPGSKLPRKPVRPEQRRRRIWRIWRISIREIVDIDQPVKPKLCCTLF